MWPEVKLTTLTDDCILKIVNFLSPVDVVNLASTCSRFFILFKCSIYPKFVKVRLASTYCKNIADKTITKELLERMMMHFGAAVQHIELNGLAFACSFLKIVLENCPQLHTLLIRRHVFTDEEVQAISNMKTNIKVLILSLCKNVKAFHSITIFPKLESIKLRKIDPDEILLQQHAMPNLAELELTLCGLPGSQLRQNVEWTGLNMRSLKIGESESLGIGPWITRTLQNIESITISFVYGSCNFNCLADLKHLKYLNMGLCCCTDITELINKLGQRGILEELILDGGTFKGNLPNFQKLRRLRLNLFHTTENIIKQLRGARFMPLITHLWIGDKAYKDELLIAVYASKKSLIQMRVLNKNRRITFSAIQQIIDYLRFRGAGRPHLKLSISSLRLSLKEVILKYT